MNKKITIITILFVLLASVSFLSARNAKQELYLKAVAEKNLESKIGLLKEYVTKYGEKKDKFLRFIYLNLADTSFKLKQYDDTIQYGEIAMSYEELDATNKLRLYFSLSNSYNLTKKDLDKAIFYADKMIEVSKSLIEQAEKASTDPEKTKQFVQNYKNYYIAPACRIQAKILYDKGEIKKAADKALESYEQDKSKKSAAMAFSLGINLFKKKQILDAIATVEPVIDKEKPTYREANFLATAYYKSNNKEKAIQYFELAYKTKQRKDLAMKIGRLVHKAQPQKGLKYFADAYVLSELNKETDAFKYLQQLYFNRIAKDKSAEEKEKGFKEVVNAAKARLGLGSVPAAEESAGEEIASTQN